MMTANNCQKSGTDYFFLDGGDCDLNYKLTRDLPEHELRKKHIENLWARYKPYADSHFKRDAQKHLLQRYWEMYLAVTLLDKGFELAAHQDEGPDICTKIDGRWFWFEAIAPTSGEGADHVSDPEMDKVYCVDVDKIALRFTGALREKRDAYEKARAKGIVKDEDGYVIAMNSALIYGGSDGDLLPYWLRGCLPLGSPEVLFNKTTGKLTGRPHHQYQEVVLKSTGAEVPVDNFLREEYRFCSAILHSSASWYYPERPLGYDFAILHNPLTLHPLGKATFPWCTQYMVKEPVDEMKSGSESGIRICIL